MPEFNILEAAGLSQIKERGGIRNADSEIREISRKVDFDYYDGDRKYGFGGYYYDGRWKKVAEVIRKRYNLTKSSKVFIQRDEKGFLSFDLKRLVPGITVYGAHVSDYPLNHAMEGYGRWAVLNGIEKEDPKIVEEKARSEIMPFLIKADNLDLPFKDGFFDCVISINSICNYEEPECRKALREIIRVVKNTKNCYVNVDSWTNEHEYKKLMEFVLLCKTFLDVYGWKRLFEEEGYEGDWGFIMFK